MNRHLLHPWDGSTRSRSDRTLTSGARAGVMGGAYHVPMTAFDGAFSPTPHYHEIMGRAAEIARALGSQVGGAEHLFLGMLHDGGWPVSAISALVDLARAEAAVLGLLGSPGYSSPPPPRFFVPNGCV